MKNILYSIIVVLLFSSCKNNLFMQRKYTKGVFREQKAKPNKAAVVKISDTEKSKMLIKELVLAEHIKAPETLIAATNPKIISIKKTKTCKPNIKIEYGCGDTIVTASNKKIACKVHLVNEKGLSYSKCKNSSSERLFIKLKNVYLIKYESGLVEMFSFFGSDKGSTTDMKSISGEYIKGEKMAVAGFVLSFISGVITIGAAPLVGVLIAGISILCIIALFTKDEYKFINHFITIVGCIISWGLIGSISLAIFAAILAIIVLIITF